MARPILLVVAGCNGAGKSSFSKLLAPKGFIPFDYDYYYLKFYRSMYDSELRETIAHNMAREELERQVNSALSQDQNFCYETNFNSTPVYWPNIFKVKGYELRMIYLCLNSVNEAKRRVAIRVKNGGHFVSDSEIQRRYSDGFRNLNENYQYFDFIDLFDTSEYLSEPKYLFSIESGRVSLNSKLPSYLTELLPDIIG